MTYDSTPYARSLPPLYRYQDGVQCRAESYDLFKQRVNQCLILHATTIRGIFKQRSGERRQISTLTYSNNKQLIMASKPSFSSFHLLSFDIYGTLIDWEAGTLDALKPLTARLPSSHSLKTDQIALWGAFNKVGRQLEGLHPGLLYSDILYRTYQGLAKQLLPEIFVNDDDVVLHQESITFAESIAHWPAFPDTVDAMRRLKQKGYLLVPLSNVDRASFQQTLAGPLAGLSDDGNASSFFDAVYTAEDIGSYKPDLRNFDYLISHVMDDFRVAKKDVLHVAHSLLLDHEPGRKAGLESVWIARGKGGVSGVGGEEKEFFDQGRVVFKWQFNTLGEFADAVERGE